MNRAFLSRLLSFFLVSTAYAKGIEFTKGTETMAVHNLDGTKTIETETKYEEAKGVLETEYALSSGDYKVAGPRKESFSWISRQTYNKLKDFYLSSSFSYPPTATNGKLEKPSPEEVKKKWIQKTYESLQKSKVISDHDKCVWCYSKTSAQTGDRIGQCFKKLGLKVQLIAGDHEIGSGPVGERVEEAFGFKKGTLISPEFNEDLNKKVRKDPCYHAQTKGVETFYYLIAAGDWGNDRWRWEDSSR